MNDTLAIRHHCASGKLPVKNAVTFPHKGTGNRAIRLSVVILVIGLVLTGGCASADKWIHPTNGSEQIVQDHSRCLYEAKLASGPPPTNQGLAGIGVNRAHVYELYKLCMASRGYLER